MSYNNLKNTIDSLHEISTTQAGMNEKQFNINDRIIKMIEELGKRLRIVEMIINDEAEEKAHLTREN
jgi:hypothetical protein